MLPMLLAAALPTSPSPSLADEAPHPDAALIALWLKFEDGLDRLRQANARYDELAESFEKCRPPYPVAARVRRRDEILFRRRVHGFSFEIGEAYSEEAIAALRRAPIHREYRRSPTESERAKYGYGKNDHIVYRAPWAFAQRRADEIMAAYDAHDAETNGLWESMGGAAAGLACDANDDALSLVIEAIQSTPAHALAGLQVKAKVTKYAHERFDSLENGVESRLLQSMITDIVGVTDEAKAI